MPVSTDIQLDSPQRREILRFGFSGKENRVIRQLLRRAG
jgi:hypothetical protein